MQLPCLHYHCPLFAGPARLDGERLGARCSMRPIAEQKPNSGLGENPKISKVARCLATAASPAAEASILGRTSRGQGLRSRDRPVADARFLPFGVPLITSLVYKRAKSGERRLEATTLQTT